MMLQSYCASFDKLRTRKIGNGICQGPQRKNRILSLSKDAPPTCRAFGEANA